MRVTLQPQQELAGLMDRSSAAFARELRRFALAYAKGEADLGEASALDELFAQSQMLADLMARRRLWLYLANVTGTATTTPYGLFGFSMPNVPFMKAVKAFFSRVPEVARKVADVAAVYARRGFTLARATELEVVKKVQHVIGTSMHKGTSRPSSIEAIEALGDWSRAYADTVYATGVATAYAAGTLEEAKDPAVRAVIPALGYVAIRDANCRPNHLALDGLIAAEDDPIWAKCAPPCGYRCRCSLRFVTAQEAGLRGVLDARGNVLRATLPPGGGRDEGFTGGRPDHAVYAAP